MTTIMENYLAAKHSREDDDFFERRVGEYHASMANNCIRRNYLDYTIGSAPGEDAWPHFQIGNVLEREYMSALQEKFGWRNVKNSIPVEVDLGKFKIVGETDPIVVNPNLDIRQLYEIKTTNGISYVRDSPKMGHVYQVHCYMKALDENDAVIVYIHKKDLETVEHLVEFDKGIWKDIVIRFSMLHRALTLEEIPDPEEDEEDQDYFCPFDDREMCCKNVSILTEDD